MDLSAHIFESAMPRLLRKALATLVLMSYLFAGVVHGLCDVDVANPKGGAIVSLVKKSPDTSGKNVVADHHCHGCFHVSLPAPSFVAAVDSVVAPQDAADVHQRRSLARIIDPPPRTI